jgi:hypothetical protein
MNLKAEQSERSPQVSLHFAINSPTIGGAAGTAVVHALKGCFCPHSVHMVSGNCFAQLGQTACVMKVSNRFLHCEQAQKLPMGGAALQEGQWNPSFRGALAS